MKRPFMFLSFILTLSLWTACGDEDVVMPPPEPELPETVVPEGPFFSEMFPEENDEIKYKTTTTFLRTIYVDAEQGDDARSGLNVEQAIKSLSRLAEMNLKPGDEVLLRGGQEHRGCIELLNFNTKEGGTSVRTHIGSYGSQKARIIAQGYPQGILVENSSFVDISDLKISANGGPASTKYMLRSSDAGKTYRYGIYLFSNKKKVDQVMISNVDIRDVYYFNEQDPNTPSNRPCREWSTNGESHYGWGIRGFSQGGTGSGVFNVTLSECNVRDVSHTGFKFNGKGNAKIYGLKIERCSIIDAGGPGFQCSHTDNSVMRHTRTIRSGARNDKRKWGRGSGVWTHTCNGLLFEHNYHEQAEGIADCCGIHIDIGNKNVMVQYTLSKHNAGGFIEVLGKNENCCYRYNISINDGWRNPKDLFQDSYWGWLTTDVNGKESRIGTAGALMTINGHTADHAFEGPYQTYVYNNTIVQTTKGFKVYKNPFVFEMATSATGILVMNNLFWIPKQMTKTWSGHYYKDGKFYSNALDFRTTTGELKPNSQYPVVRDMTQEEIDKLDFIVKNNLYQLYDEAFPLAHNALPYNVDVLDSKVRYWDEQALGGNPMFGDKEGTEAENMIPRDAAVINRGLAIPQLATDHTSYGVAWIKKEDAAALPSQLQVDKDFFGRPITTPILGACVPQ